MQTILFKIISSNINSVNLIMSGKKEDLFSIISSDGEIFKVSKDILKENSLFFRNMFNSNLNLKENETNSIRLNFQGNILEYVVKYIKEPDNKDNIPPKMFLLDVILAADFLGV